MVAGMRTLAPLLLLVLLGGCSGTWSRAAAGSQADLDRDSAGCRLVASGVAVPGYSPAAYPRSANYVAAANSLSGTSTTFAAAMVRNQSFEDCLRAQGWVKE